MENREIILTRFREVCNRLNSSLEQKDLNPIEIVLIDTYGGIGRMYHDFSHIVFCLQELDKYCEVGNLTQEERDILDLAIIFHDFHYDINLVHGLNEKISAILFSAYSKILGLSFDISCSVSNLIRATFIYPIAYKTYEEDKHTLFYPLICDIDFSILGQNLNTVIDYNNKIYYEYVSWGEMDEKKYLNDRKSFLESLLKSDKIYFTDYFAEKYEKEARKNIQHLLDVLC